MADNEINWNGPAIVGDGKATFSEKVSEHKKPIILGLVLAALTTLGYTGYSHFKKSERITIQQQPIIPVHRPKNYLTPGSESLDDKFTLELPNDIKCTTQGSDMDLIERTYEVKDRTPRLIYKPLKLKKEGLYTCMAKHPADILDKAKVYRLFDNNTKVELKSLMVDNDIFTFRLPSEPGFFELNFNVGNKKRVVVVDSGKNQKPQEISEPYNVDLEENKIRRGVL